MIDEELKKRAWNPEAKSHKVPREKVVKVGKMITDVIDHKFGKITTQDAEYWGLEALLTDEMCDIMLAMGRASPTPSRNSGSSATWPRRVRPISRRFWTSFLSWACWNTTTAITMTTTGRTAPQSERRYSVPMFVPGSAELLNIDESGSGENPCYDERGEIPYNKRLAEHPELAPFFERMTYVPLAGKTHLMPPVAAAWVCTSSPWRRPSPWRTRAWTSSIFPTG